MKKILLFSILTFILIAITSCKKEGEILSIDVDNYNCAIIKGYASEKVEEVGILISLDSNPTADNAAKIPATTRMNDGSYEVKVNFLFPATVNYCRSYVIIGNQTTLSKEIKTFETPDVEAIDLGLSSGLKWAICNIGASKPEDFGGYYSWGETKVKDNYSEKNYKYYNGDGPFYKKYNIQGGILGNVSIINGEIINDPETPQVDNITEIEKMDDAAYRSWGGKWRIPTEDECLELYTECEWAWNNINGVEGILVKGPNGNSIFLPAAGRCVDTKIYGRGKAVHYWSSTLNSLFSMLAQYMDAESGTDRALRSVGLPIRPVHE